LSYGRCLWSVVVCTTTPLLGHDAAIVGDTELDSVKSTRAKLTIETSLKNLVCKPGSLYT